jgi:aspartyl-tRNA synthetase
LRTHLATELVNVEIGTEIKVAGWVDSHRDHGGVVFIDLRDKSGLIQLVLDPEDSGESHKLGHEIRDEFVIIAKGYVRSRGEGLENPKLETGKIEESISTLFC